MTKLNLSQDVLALNPALGKREQKLARLDGDNYKSELERRFAREWIGQQSGVVVRWWYEPMSFNLAGGRYTPDFMVLFVSNKYAPVFFEVKGWTKSFRADRRAFKEAAGTHTWAKWVWVTWDKQTGWQEEWL